jgi:acetone carboxylase gamma subunit
VRITEYLDINLQTKKWCCNRCGYEIFDAGENYKKGCLIYERDPREVHNTVLPESEFNFAPDPDWCRLIEIYCPGCGTMVEVEYLPPGHPLTEDIVIDLEQLLKKYEKYEEYKKHEKRGGRMV